MLQRMEKRSSPDNRFPFFFSIIFSTIFVLSATIYAFHGILGWHWISILKILIIDRVGDLAQIDLRPIGKIPFNMAFCILFGALFGVAVFIHFIFLLLTRKTQSFPWRRHVMAAAIVVFIVSFALNSFNQFLMLQGRMQIFSGKTTSQKNALIFFQTYRSAEFCRKTHPGYHRAQLLSDLKSADGGSTEAAHRNALRYHLYPVDIDGTSRRADKPDSYVLWFKDNFSGLPELNSVSKIYPFENHALLILR
jgi:hypothetical protein